MSCDKKTLNELERGLSMPELSSNDLQRQVGKLIEIDKEIDLKTELIDRHPNHYHDGSWYQLTQFTAYDMLDFAEQMIKEAFHRLNMESDFREENAINDVLDLIK